MKSAKKNLFPTPLFENLRKKNIFLTKTEQESSGNPVIYLQKSLDYKIELGQETQEFINWYRDKKSSIARQKLAPELQEAQKIADDAKTPWTHFDSKLKLNVKTNFPRHETDYDKLADNFDADFMFHTTPEVLKLETQKTISRLNNLFLETKKFNETYDFGPRMQELYSFVDDIFLDLKKPTRQNKSFDIWFNHKLEVQERLLNEILEVNKLEEKLQFSNYQNTFLEARKMNRKIKIFLGPTNSGKTYAAFEELKKAGTGCYLAPLRLLAHEGVDKLFERAVLSNLMTGEERKEIPGATHTCSTIEMCQLKTKYDCMVIDEIQMLNDSQRGWAWTQALVGAQAKELILVGSPEIMPKLQPILDDLKEEYEIVHFERKNELKLGNSLGGDISKMKNGDCLVVFNRKDALGYKRRLTEMGKTCSVVYGNLSPEVRVMEARRFNSGATDVIVATDAIGMGLNLPIKRIFFSKVEKFNGYEQNLIEPSLIKQISGRAGRYGHVKEPGIVSTLHDDDLDYLTSCVNMPYPEKYEDTRCFIQPNVAHIEEICSAIKTKKIAPALIYFKEKMVSQSKLFKPSNLDDMIYLAQHIDRVKPALSIKEAYLYCCAPVDVKHDKNFEEFLSWVMKAQTGEQIEAPVVPSGVNKKTANDYNLFEAESFVKLANLYRWLYYHWPESYSAIDKAKKEIDLASDYIESVLSQKSEKIGLHSQKKRRRF